MTKLLGALIISFFGFFSGYSMTKNLREKSKILREMIRATELLRCEILARNSFERTALKLSKLLTGRSSDFFTSMYLNTKNLSELGFFNLWNKSVLDNFSEFLSKDELLDFCALGAVISTGEDPERGFLKCTESLERLAIESENRALRDGKMYMGVGLSMGLMLSIVLI